MKKIRITKNIEKKIRKAMRDVKRAINRLNKARKVTKEQLNETIDI